MNTHKLPAFKITLMRKEGTVQEIRDGLAVLMGPDVFGKADELLCEWSRTAPRVGAGGYHKCHFVVEYTDGETYEGRYDLKAGEGVSLGAHMESHLKRVAGRQTPPGRTATEWAAFLANVVGAERCAAAGLFLDTYRIG